MVRMIAIGLFTACIVVALIVMTPVPRQSAVSAEVSVGEAEKLVETWLSTHKDQCPHNDHPKLEEITTSEIRERLHAQVFRVRDRTWATFDAYLVKSGAVYPMSLCFGGWGLMDMRVLDVDGDSREELVYVYSFGSGMHRAMVEGYRCDRQTATKIPTRFAVEADISLQSRNGIDVYSGNLRLGELVLLGSGKDQSLDIRLDPKLPKEWEKRVWRHHRAD